MTLYDRIVAARDAAHVNERLDRIWRLGGFVLNVRTAIVRIHAVNGRSA